MRPNALKILDFFFFLAVTLQLKNSVFVMIQN